MCTMPMPVLNMLAYRRYLEELGYTREQAEAYAVVATQVCEASKVGDDIDLAGGLQTLVAAHADNPGEWIACAMGFFRPWK